MGICVLGCEAWGRRRRQGKVGSKGVILGFTKITLMHNLLYYVSSRAWGWIELKRKEKGAYYLPPRGSEKKPREAHSLSSTWML